MQVITSTALIWALICSRTTFGGGKKKKKQRQFHEYVIGLFRHGSVSLERFAGHLQVVVPFCFRQLGEIHETRVLPLVVVPNLRRKADSLCHSEKCKTCFILLAVIYQRLPPIKPTTAPRKIWFSVFLTMGKTYAGLQPNASAVVSGRHAFVCFPLGLCWASGGDF